MASSSGGNDEIAKCEPLLSCCRIKLNALFRCIVFLPESFGKLSVCHCALPTMPTVCEKEPPRGAHNSWVPKETCVVSRLCGKLCLWGERGNGDSLMYIAPLAFSRIVHIGKSHSSLCISDDLVSLHSGFGCPLAPWTAVSLCQCDVPVLWHGSHQRPGEWYNVCREKGFGWIKMFSCELLFI